MRDPTSVVSSMIVLESCSSEALSSAYTFSLTAAEMVFSSFAAVAASFT